MSALPPTSSITSPVTDSVPSHAVAAQSSHWKTLRPRQGWQMCDWRRLWQFRELLGILAMRDIKVRYKQTLLGMGWAIIQPVTMMVVMSVFFGRFAQMDQKVGHVPYPIFLYAALLPWTFFSASVTASANSLIANAGMLRKIYFPRLIMPLSATGTPLVDYAMAFGVLLGLMGWYEVPVTAHLLLLPVLVVLTILAALGVGLILSAITVRYRDVRYVVPFMLQVWFFITPVIYPGTMIPGRWHALLPLNPMAGIISGFRAAILGTPQDWSALGIAALVSIVSVGIGLSYFNQVERKFADVV